MAENIPSWTPADERELERLQERKEKRARMLSERVEKVADDIIVHNMNSTELAQALVENADAVSRVLRPFLKGPFKAAVFAAGDILHEGGAFDRIELKEWSHRAILDELDAGGWITRDFLNELTDLEVDSQGNRLQLRIDGNVASVGYLMIVRMSSGEGEY